MSNTTSYDLVADRTFGPQYGSSFDFTIEFDLTILSILPMALFVLATPIFIFVYKKAPDFIAPSQLLWIKLSAAATLFSIEVANLALWVSSPSFRSPTSIFAAALSCTASLFLLPVLHLEHRHTLRSSTVLASWFFLVTLCDGVRARSYLRRDELHNIGVLTCTLAIIRLSIVLLQEVSKEPHIKDEDIRKSVGREATSGFWNRSLFLWLNSTFLQGYRNILTINDLDNLGPSFSSKSLSEKLQANLVTYQLSGKFSLALVLLKTFLGPFLGIIIPRVSFSVFMFLQPQFIGAVIAFVQNSDSNSAEGAGLIVASVLIYAGVALSRSLYKHMTFQLVTLIRGALVGEIFSKSLRISFLEAQETVATTLMSTEMDGIVAGVPDIHEFWICFLEIGAGVYLIARIIKEACVLVLIPTIINSVATYFLGNKFGPARGRWSKATQTRVSGTSTILQQIKAIKAAGLEFFASSRLQSLRNEEMLRYKEARRWSAIMAGLALSCNLLCGPMLIAGGLFWTVWSGELNAKDAFTILALASVISEPVQSILFCYETVIMTFTSFGRIQDYLNTEEPEDPRAESISEGRISTSVLMRHQMGHTEQDSVEMVSYPHRQERLIIEVCDATIAARDSDKIILRNISVSVERGEVLMVVGTTGCGKSMFLRTLLGETKVLSGSVYVGAENFAYCGQTPWLQNLTIKGIITAGDDTDEEWYQSVLDAFLLIPDLQQLPNGDQTKTGSDGSVLSGGQKQRVAAARAVFSRKPLLVMDDVFNSLDHQTASQIFLRLFGSTGLLRRNKTTVVMVTNSSQFLDGADRIIFIEEDGAGTLLSELETSMYFEELKKDLDNRGDISTQTRHEPSTDEDALLPGELNLEKELLLEKEDLQRKTGDTTLYWFYLRLFPRVMLVLFLFTAWLSAWVEVCPDIYMRVWLDTRPDHELFFVGYAALSGVSGVLCFLSLSLWYQKLAPVAANNAHDLVLQRLMRSTLYFLTSTDHGVILNLFSQDMTAVSQKLPLAFLKMVYVLAVSLLRVGTILAVSYYTGILAPIFLASLYFLQKWFLQTSRQMRHLELEAKSPLYTHFTETATGLRHIKAFGWQTRAFEQVLELLDHSQKPFYHSFSLQQWLALVLDMKALVVGTIIVSLAVCLKHTTTGAAVGLSLVGLISMTIECSVVVVNWTEFEQSMGSMARMRNFLTDTPLEKDKESPDATIPKDWPAQGRVELQNVTSKYSPSATATNVLNDISVSIHPGQKVGIIGRTGSGKSSFLLTILRFLEYSGIVIIDGVDVSSIPLHELRKRIVSISQDPLEFDESIRFNLCPWISEKDAQRSGMHDAACKAILESLGLWTLVQLNGGLDAKASVVKFSHGQKQLMAIARACMQIRVMNSKLVIIDEATSSLDPDTETMAREVMQELFSDCTVLTVAHNTKSLTGYDMILEISNGRIVQQTFQTGKRCSTRETGARVSRTASESVLGLSSEQRIQHAYEEMLAQLGRVEQSRAPLTTTSQDSSLGTEGSFVSDKQRKNKKSRNRQGKRNKGKGKVKRRD